MTLAEMKAELAKVEAKISEVLDTGQSYSITGSHSVTNTSIEHLERRAAQLRRRIYRFQGYTGRNRPDFEATGRSKDYTD